MYRLVFANPEYGSYDYLQDEEDLYAAIKEECYQSVSDRGSEGYELIWPDYVEQQEALNTGFIERWLESLSPEEAEEQTLAAHDRGIERSAALWAVGIFDDLWRGQPDENGITWSQLPFNGPTIFLDAQENYDPSPTYFG